EDEEPPPDVLFVLVLLVLLVLLVEPPVEPVWPEAALPPCCPELFPEALPDEEGLTAGIIGATCWLMSSAMRSIRLRATVAWLISSRPLWVSPIWTLRPTYRAAMSNTPMAMASTTSSSV